MSALLGNQLNTESPNDCVDKGPFGRKSQISSDLRTKIANVAFPSINTTTRLSNGTTYSYVYIKSSNQKPYILFLHGWPSSSYDWRHQINYFSELGYGVIAPDLLGYGGTDKPKDLEAYRMKKMSEEVVEVLEAQKVGKVLGVGHDLWVSIRARSEQKLTLILVVAGPFCCLALPITSPSDLLALLS